MKLGPLFAPDLAAARLSPLMAGTLGVLALAAICAAGFAAFALLGPQYQESLSNAPEWKPPTLAAVELAPPKPASADAQSLSRPIFSKNRKPAPRTSATALVDPSLAAPVVAPAGLSLAAVVRHGGVASAFLLSASAPEGEWKKIGEKIESWTVAAITDLEVTLKNGDQSVQLRLFDEPRQ